MTSKLKVLRGLCYQYHSAKIMAPVKFIVGAHYFCSNAISVKSKKNNHYVLIYDQHQNWPTDYIYIDKPAYIYAYVFPLILGFVCFLVLFFPIFIKSKLNFAPRKAELPFVHFKVFFGHSFGTWFNKIRLRYYVQSVGQSISSRMWLTALLST